MIDRNELAQLLALASGAYNTRAHLALTEERQVAACRELHAFGVLSPRAIASVLGCPLYRVEHALSGLPKSDARGKLNPEHLQWLGYMLADGKARPQWVRVMVQEGTSVSTIADLTGISRSTLDRRKV